MAFSNADGGVMLVGVRDDGEIAGRPLDAGTEDAIHQAIGNARDPGRYGLAQVDVDGRPVCVISIARRREGFAQTSGGVVKVRRGTRDDPLFGVELVRFANERTASATRRRRSSRHQGRLAQTPCRTRAGHALGES